MDKDEFRYLTPQQAGVVHHPKGFFGNLGRSFQVYNWVGQIATHGMPAGNLNAPVAGYRVTEDPQFKGDLRTMLAAVGSDSQSPAESAEIIRRYQRYRQIKQQIEIDGSWVAPVIAGVLDPINLIPIPGMLGQGLVRGAIRGGVGIGTTGALSEGLRTHLDPSTTKTEAGVHMGAAVVLGLGMGATLGRLHYVPKRLAPDPIQRAARSYDNAIQGGTELVDEAAQPMPPVRPEVIRTETAAVRTRAARGDEAAVEELDVLQQQADLGLDQGAVPPPTITEWSQFVGRNGVAMRRGRDGTRHVQVNKLQIQKGFQNDAWVGARGLPKGAFKSVQEWQDFLIEEATVKAVLTKLPKESMKAFNKRVSDETFKRVKGKEGQIKERPRGYTAKSQHLQKLRANAETMDVERAELKAELAELKRRRAAGEKTVQWTEGKDLSGDEITGYRNSSDKLAEYFKISDDVKPC